MIADADHLAEHAVAGSLQHGVVEIAVDDPVRGQSPGLKEPRCNSLSPSLRLFSIIGSSRRAFSPRSAAKRAATPSSTARIS